VDVGPGAQQLPRGAPLVVKGDPFGGNRHQRRRAAGQQDEQRIVVSQRAGDLQRAPAGAFAAGIRNRMAGGDRLEGAERVSRWRDDQAGPQPVAQHARRTRRHRDRRLAGGDTQIALVAGRVGNGASRERHRVARTNAGPDDVQEMLAKLSV
jgi:hypothetical protein